MQLLYLSTHIEGRIFQMVVGGGGEQNMPHKDYTLTMFVPVN